MFLLSIIATGSDGFLLFSLQVSPLLFALASKIDLVGFPSTFCINCEHSGRIKYLFGFRPGVDEKRTPGSSSYSLFVSHSGDLYLYDFHSYY